MIDGLGHGAAAADASRLAGEVLREDPTRPVDELVTRCHERLKGTRGAVIAVATIDAHAAAMTWVGVGNIEGIVVRAGLTETSLPSRGGIIGFRIPTLHPRVVPMRA